MPLWFDILFGILAVGTLACVIALFLLKADVGETGPAGAKGDPGSQGDIGFTGLRGQSGPPGVPGTAGAISSVYTIEFTAVSSQDYILFVGPFFTLRNLPAVVTKSEKIVTISGIGPQVQPQDSRRDFYLRFTLPFPLISIDPKNVIFCLGYLNNQTAGSQPILLIDVSIISVSVVRCHFFSMSGNIWSGSGNNPILGPYFTLQYVMA
jgi:hypothetical protein